MSYEPPFKITAKSINMISEISAFVERAKINSEKADNLKLIKINRMKTIRGSLAIEGNSLSEEQVTALIDGKHIIAPLKEIQEVRNAIKVYESFDEFDAYDWKDLLKAHEIMAFGLVDHPGHFRKTGVCVAGKDGISHIAPPADRLPFLISDLFDWLKNAEDHPLIKSCVFHYEFEFIHPFEDGNGRMGRLWQSKILSDWNRIFANLPVENMIWENQAEYYKAIAESTKNTDSGIFTEFMLSLIVNTLKKHAVKNDTVNDNVNDNVNGNVKITRKITVKITANQKKILDAIKQKPFATQEELSEIVGITKANINKNMKKLQENGIIERIGADKNGEWKIVKL